MVTSFGQHRITYISIALIIIVICGSVLVMKKYFNTSQEKFVANLKTALCTNILQHNSWLRKKAIQARAVSFDNETWTETAPKLKQPLVLASVANTSDILYVADPLEASTFFKDRQVVTQGPKGYFCALYNPQQALLVDCTINLQNKRVGFLDRSDFYFIKAIVNSYRMKSPLEIRQVPLNEWDNLEKLLTYYDVIITYIIPNSDLHRLLQTQEISIRGFKNLDIDRVRLFYPFIQIENVKITDALKNVPGSALKIAYNANETMLPSMRMLLILLKGKYFEKFQGNFHLELSEDATDPSYRCFGDLDIEQKALCNSPYDVIGMKKKRQTIWDRPCVRDEDCPFFKANQNYPNKRGGCLKGGVCEMPIGIKRTAYRTYIDQGQYSPFCYGCDDPQGAADPNCCSKQYLPDYAFANDTQERRAAGLKETIINMN